MLRSNPDHDHPRLDRDRFHCFGYPPAKLTPNRWIQHKARKHTRQGLAPETGEIVDESGVLKGRQPWKREIRRDDQMVAERLDHILHDEITETQVDMVKTAH